MKKIPFYLVTGFLGSGKTTFLKKMLAAHASQLRIAVIQNEFAPANIDGTDLKSEHEAFEILEINNGSVFCVCQLSHFVSSLSSFLKEFHPEVIFLEASGLSDPISVAQILEFDELREKLYLAKVWTIVDASHFLKQQKLITRLQHQVRTADTLLINKSDLVTADDLIKVSEVIRTLNPFAEILTSTFCKPVEKDLILEMVADPVATKQKALMSNFESCGRPDIRVGVFRNVNPVNEEKIMQLIKEYVPKTIRIKGYIQLIENTGLAIQTSYEQISFQKISSYIHGTELIVMGEDFSLSRFRKAFKTCLA